MRRAKGRDKQKQKRTVPALTASIYRRTLQKAAELMGGREELARELGASVAELNDWLAAKAPVPPAIFLSAVDLVISESPAPPGGDSDPADPTGTRECAGRDFESGRY